MRTRRGPRRGQASGPGVGLTRYPGLLTGPRGLGPGARIAAFAPLEARSGLLCAITDTKADLSVAQEGISTASAIVRRLRLGRSRASAALPVRAPSSIICRGISACVRRSGVSLRWCSECWSPQKRKRRSGRLLLKACPTDGRHNPGDWKVASRAYVRFRFSVTINRAGISPRL
jgi:hypothetical protein